MAELDDDFDDDFDEGSATPRVPCIDAVRHEAPAQAELCFDFADVHEFRDWLLTSGDEDGLELIGGGAVRIAGHEVDGCDHAKGDRFCGAFGAREAGYGYCPGCDLILEHEEHEEHEDLHDDPFFEYRDRSVWFPLDWDRRSRDGWIRVRNERAIARRHR